MLLPFTACTVFLLASFTTATGKLHPLSDEFIAHLNKKQNSWKAGRNFVVNTPMSYIKSLTGVIKNDPHLKLPVMAHDPYLIASLPDNFDPREKWSQCSSLTQIRDQGGCGSCWAFGAVEAMTDRICIYSNGSKLVHLSAQDLVSCCSGCGSGCHGGNPQLAWEYWKTDGIVTGGPYNSSEGCKPYLMEPCAHHNNYQPLPPCTQHETPQCETQCESNYNVDYVNDKQYGKSVYSIEGEGNIQAELYKNGPVEADFTVYDDFLNYKSGVYQHTDGEAKGGHAVKMMGWGVEDGKKYWLMANSWNESWGDKGYFKILRGTNECGIESGVVAGEPKLD